MIRVITVAERVQSAKAGGRPCIRGMRVNVGTIVGLVAAGHAREEIVRLYPYLEPEDVSEALAAATHALGPSVIQVRTHDPIPNVVGRLVLSAISTQRGLPERGALITIEPERMRVRVLPIVPGLRES